MKKLSTIFLKLFAAGIILCLFSGGITIIGYLAGIIIGGETASEICTFIFKTYFPFIIKLTSIFTGFGLIGMYMSKQKTLVVQTEDIKNQDKKK